MSKHVPSCFQAQYRTQHIEKRQELVCGDSKPNCTIVTDSLLYDVEAAAAAALNFVVAFLVISLHHTPACQEVRPYKDIERCRRMSLPV